MRVIVAHKFPHAALADEGSDIAVAKSGADVQGHRLW